MARDGKFVRFLHDAGFRMLRYHTSRCDCDLVPSGPNWRTTRFAQGCLGCAAAKKSVGAQTAAELCCTTAQVGQVCAKHGHFGPFSDETPIVTGTLLRLMQMEFVADSHVLGNGAPLCYLIAASNMSGLHDSLGALHMPSNSLNQVAGRNSKL